MKYEFTTVPTESVPMFWPQVQELLMKCPETWSDFETLESIYDRLSRGTRQLALILVGTKVEFAGIFQVVHYPVTKSIQIVWGSGRIENESLGAFIMGMEHLAKKHKFEWVEYGPMRNGFERLICPFGYERARIMTRKKISVETIQ